MALISGSLLLIAIIGGAHLLAYARKENLGNFFKFISWFVIGTALVGMFSMGMRKIMFYRYYKGEMSSMPMHDGCNCGMCMGREHYYDRAYWPGMRHRQHEREDGDDDSMDSTRTKHVK